MNDESRARVSDKLARELSQAGAFGTAIYLARAESDNPPSIPCSHCSYLSKSHHEAALHARLH